MDTLDPGSRRPRPVLRIIVIAAVVLGLLTAIGVLFGDDDKASTEDSPLRAIGVSAGDAGCGDPTKDDDEDDAAQHRGGRIEYDRSPPASGPHNPTPLRQGIRFHRLESEPEAEQAVHNLEHGYVVVWYAPDAPAADLEVLEAAVHASEFRKLIAVPWTRGGHTGGPFFVTAWRVRMSCSRVSGDVLQDFIDAWGGDKGLAPEPNAP